MCIKMNILNSEKYYKVKRYRTGWKKYSQGWKLFVTHIANKGLTLKKKFQEVNEKKTRNDKRNIKKVTEKKKVKENSHRYETSIQINWTYILIEIVSKIFFFNLLKCSVAELSSTLYTVGKHTNKYSLFEGQSGKVC